MKNLDLETLRAVVEYTRDMDQEELTTFSQTCLDMIAKMRAQREAALVEAKAIN